MFYAILVLILCAGVLALQCAALRIERKSLEELRALAAAVQELKNRRP